jgi:hypothetical protein
MIKQGLFKFKYGEEIIADYELIGDNYYIKNGAGLIPAEDMGWRLLTWMPYTNIKDGLLLPKSEVWFVADLHQEMSEYYEKWKTMLKIQIEEEKLKIKN